MTINRDAQIAAWAESMLSTNPDADVSDEAYTRYFADDDTPCRERNGTFTCQRGVHVGQCESVHSVDVMKPGHVLIVRWGNGCGSKTFSKRVVL